MNVCFGGYWRGLEYVGGEIEQTSIPFGDHCFECLYQSVYETIYPIESGWIILLHSLDDGSTGNLVKKKIKNNFDVQCLLTKSDGRTLDVFVTLKNMSNFLPGGMRHSQDRDGGPHHQQENYMSAGPSSTHIPAPYENPVQETPEENITHAATDPREYIDCGLDGVRVVDLEDDDGHVDIVRDVDGAVNDETSADKVPVVEVKRWVQAVLEEWSSWCGVRDDILSKALTVFQRKQKNWGARDTESNTNTDWDNTNALDYTGRGWVIPGAPNVIPGEPENLFNVAPIEVGATYMSKEDLLFAVGTFRLKNKGSYRVKYSEPRRYTLVCDNTNCPFQIAATAKKDFWNVLRVTDHECAADPRINDYQRVPAKVVATHFANRLLTEKSKLVPSSMIDEFNETYSIRINYDLMLRAKHKAMTLIFGSEKTSFGMLPSYLYMLRQTIPGTITGFQVDEENKFQNAFFALGPAIRGFRDGGRPVIVVDGTFLTGKYKGILFAAVTQDGNKQIYPLAVGIGHIENDAAWSWFLNQVKGAYGTPDDLVIISDGARSIKNAINAVFPQAHQGLCNVHLTRNLRGAGKHAIGLFKEAAYSFVKSDCHAKMKTLLEVSPGTYEHLMGLGIERWARSCCPVSRYDFMTSNAAESYNNRAIWARTLPVTSVFEVLRSVAEKWFYERHTAAMSRNTELTEDAELFVADTITRAAKLNANPLQNNRFKVQERLQTHVVDMSNRSCTCRQFDRLLLPCVHACAAARLVLTCSPMIIIFHIHFL